MKGLEERSGQYANGAWQKMIFAVLSDKSLQMENLFDCEVAIPGTDYRVTKSIVYAPGKYLIIVENRIKFIGWGTKKKSLLINNDISGRASRYTYDASQN